MRSDGSAPAAVLSPSRCVPCTGVQTCSIRSHDGNHKAQCLACRWLETPPLSTSGVVARSRAPTAASGKSDKDDVTVIPA